MRLLQNEVAAPQVLRCILQFSPFFCYCFFLQQQLAPGEIEGERGRERQGGRAREREREIERER
jgi:hypothetical protein